MQSTHPVIQQDPLLKGYLVQATLGLSKEQKQEVWDELEEHILTRANHLELQGIPPSQTIAHALTEMGSPILVSAGMNKVHNMPKLIALASLTAITISASFYALASSGNAITLEAESLRLSECQEKSCIETSDGDTYNGVYFNLNKMKKVFDELDVTVTDMKDGNWRLSTKEKKLDVKPVFSKDGEPYVKGDFLLNEHVLDSSSTQLTGFNSPALKVKDLKVELEGNGQRIFEKLREPLVQQLYPKDTAPKDLVVVPRVGELTHNIQTEYDPGEVIMLVERYFQKCEAEVNTCTPKSAYMVSFSEVKQNGMIQFKSEYQTINFKQKREDLSLATNSREGNAMLVKVTNVPLNDLRTGTFVPSKEMSAAGQ